MKRLKMPPKKRDKDSVMSRNSAVGDVTHHELFLQAFEKPTQIYRYMELRNKRKNKAPLVFLNRTLGYMKHRMSRSHKSRIGFKVDSLLEKLNPQHPPPYQYMTLTFLGFYDKEGDYQDEPVKVETLLLKICHKKRKDVSCPVMTTSLGTSYVAYNPRDDYSQPQVPTVCISTEAFNFSNGHTVKSYRLVLRVGTSCDSIVIQQNTSSSDDDPECKRRRLNSSKEAGGRQFVFDLEVYDKHERCLLADGDYELCLEQLTTTPPPPPARGLNRAAITTWETLDNSILKSSMSMESPLDQFSCSPKLKLRLHWSPEPINAFVERPRAIATRSNRSSDAEAPAHPFNSSPMQIVYQFIYNNNSRQQTESSFNLDCPWCSLDCANLYSLLKHFKLTHSRFTFTYVPSSTGSGGRVDVAINEHYDGTYTGSPQDLLASGMAFGRNGPVRRTSVTHVIVCHPKRSAHHPPSLAEFLQPDESERDAHRPHTVGHNRLYYHTKTCLPIFPKEMDHDSEDENDPPWLQKRTSTLIDEFTDVNEGEKCLMTMWNLHVMRNGFGYVGDNQIPLACYMFVQEKGLEILQTNTYRNFLLHMGNLYDFGLMTPAVYAKVIAKLHEVMAANQQEAGVINEAVCRQKAHWTAVGATKKAARLLIGANGETTNTTTNSSSMVQPRRKLAGSHLTSSPCMATASSSSAGDSGKKQRLRRSPSPAQSDSVSKKRTSDLPVRAGRTPGPASKTLFSPDAAVTDKGKSASRSGNWPRRMSAGGSGGGVSKDGRRRAAVNPPPSPLASRRKSFHDATESMRKKASDSYASTSSMQGDRRRSTMEHSTKMGS